MMLILKSEARSWTRADPMYALISGSEPDELEAAVFGYGKKDVEV